MKIKNFIFISFIKILFGIKSLFAFFVEYENCLCCGKRTILLPLCKKCAKNFKIESLQTEKKCKNCGKPLLSEIEVCSACRNGAIIKSSNQVFPLQTYRLWKKNLLFSWKMEEMRNLSLFFAELVEKKILQIEKKFCENLPIVPVPPRPNKIREKGWDQIDELCFYLKNAYNRKILKLLYRKTKIQQKKLDRVHRLQTIGSSYFPINENKIKKICKKLPESVILLDDVLTTGSTIEDCSRILKEIGVKKVYAITLFIVD